MPRKFRGLERNHHIAKIVAEDYRERDVIPPARTLYDCRQANEVAFDPPFSDDDLIELVVRAGNAAERGA